MTYSVRLCKWQHNGTSIPGNADTRTLLCGYHVVFMFFDATAQVLPLFIYFQSRNFFRRTSVSALSYAALSSPTCPTSMNKRHGESASLKTVNNLGLGFHRKLDSLCSSNAQYYPI